MIINICGGGDTGDGGDTPTEPEDPDPEELNPPIESQSYYVRRVA